MRKKRSKIRRFFVVATLVIIGVATIYNMFFEGLNKVRMAEEVGSENAAVSESSEEATGTAVAVKAFKVSRSDFEDYHNNFGTLKGALEFKLSFPIAGIIESINYKEGQRYKKGALLMSLKQDDIMLRLKRSEAKLKQAIANEDIAYNKYKEHQKLFDIGAIPKSTLDKVKLEYQATKYEREAVELQVRADESILEKSNLYAPSDGMIGELNVEVGESVTSNTLLGTHIYIEEIKAEFGVIEQEVSKIKPGQKALVSVDAYPDRVFEGVVDRVSPIVTGTSRTANTEIKIPNHDGLLLPGMSARIRILLYSKKNVMVIPAEAVVKTDDRSDAVYVIDENTNKVRLVKVVQDYASSNYAVIEEGLNEGDLIAISGFENLSDGASIDIMERQEL